MTVKIYHNPRCSKSRQALQLLQNKGLDSEVVLYLEQGLTKEEVDDLLQKLQCRVGDIIRKKETEFKEMELKDASEDALIESLVKCPKLLERPIVIYKDKAAIGRPIDNIEELLTNQ